MEKLPFSFTSNLLEISSLVDSLAEAISTANRVNIIRACSNIMYSLSDMLEHVTPDGFEVIVKPSDFSSSK